jgi:hypothetical protein
LQGEGQEFESPRLHHLLLGRTRPPTVSPLLRVLVSRPPTSGLLGDPDDLRSSRPSGRTLPTGYVKSVEREVTIFDFAVLSEKSRSPSTDDRWVSGWRGSSYTGHEVDALAPRADEGRGRLRKAPGSREQTLYPEMSEWGNPAGEVQSLLAESNRPGGGKPAN